MDKLLPENNLFRRYRYLDVDFPFAIWREKNSVRTFNKSRQFQREFWKVIHILRGCGDKLINGERYPFGPGSLFLIHPHDLTTFDVRSPEGIELCNIVFLPSFLGELQQKLPQTPFFSILQPELQEDTRPDEMLFITGTDPEINRIERALLREYEHQESGSRLRIALLLTELLLLFSRKTGSRNRKLSPQNILNQLDRLIEKNFRESPKLDWFSERLGVTPAQLCRLCRTASGESVMTRLRRRKLKEAALLLQTTALPLQETALRAGFRDLSGFCRLFRENFREPPGTYREKQKHEI